METYDWSHDGSSPTIVLMDEIRNESKSLFDNKVS